MADRRTNAAGPLSNRIDQYLRTSQVNGVVYDTDENSRKRPATEDLSESVKRQRSEPDMATMEVDPAISAAFLLDPSNPMALYDSRLIPHPIVVEIIMRTMEILPAQMIEDRLNVLSSPISLRIVGASTFADGSETCGTCNRYERRHGRLRS